MSTRKEKKHQLLKKYYPQPQQPAIASPPVQAPLTDEQIFTMNTELLEIKISKVRVLDSEKATIDAVKLKAKNAPNSISEGIQEALDDAWQQIRTAKEMREREMQVLEERERLLRNRLGSRAERWEGVVERVS